MRSIAGPAGLPRRFDPARWPQRRVTSLARRRRGQSWRPGFFTVRRPEYSEGSSGRSRRHVGMLKATGGNFAAAARQVQRLAVGRGASHPPSAAAAR